MGDTRTPKNARWATGQQKVHLAHPLTGCCLGCKKKVAAWPNAQDKTVEEVKNSDFGLCSFVSDFWLDRFTK
jgi:hypothetical protein